MMLKKKGNSEQVMYVVFRQETHFQPMSSAIRVHNQEYTQRFETVYSRERLILPKACIGVAKIPAQFL
jgi:hypothetical protein